MATHSSILAWRIPWIEEPGRLQFIGSQRIRHDWSNLQCTHRLNKPFYMYIHTHTHQISRSKKWPFLLTVKSQISTWNLLSIPQLSKKWCEGNQIFTCMCSRVCTTGEESHSYNSQADTGSRHILPSSPLERPRAWLWKINKASPGRRFYNPCR